MENPFTNLTAYEVKHLPKHIEKAGRNRDLHRLLVLETRARSNAWFDVKEQCDSIAGYLDDVRMALRVAEQEFAAQKSPRALGFQCRYALILASLAGLAKKLKPEILSALVKNNQWPYQKGVTYARLIPGAAQRAQALALLSSHVPENEKEHILQEALEAATMTANSKERLKILSRLAPHLPASLKTQARLRAKTAEKALRKTLEEEYGLTDDEELIDSARSELEATLAREMAFFEESENGEKVESSSLREISGSTEVEVKTVETAQIDDLSDQRRARSSLFPYISSQLHSRRSKDFKRFMKHDRADAVAATPDSFESEKVSSTMRAKHPHILSEEEVELKLRSALDMDHERERDRALKRLVPFLGRQGLLEVYAESKELKQEYDRIETLIEIIPHLIELNYVEEALDEIRRLISGQWIWALPELLPLLAEQGYADEALTAALDLKREDHFSTALANLFPHLPDMLLYEALSMSLRIEDETQWSKVLEAIVSRFMQLSDTAFCRLWKEMLHRRLARGRSAFLRDLSLLPQIISAFGDSDAIDETFRSVEDVARWWP
jgi:hypothetical protein